MKRNWKVALFWVLGSACIFLGSTIVGEVEKDIGVTEAGYFLAMLVAFILFLLGGLFWISVSLAARRIIEE